MHGGRSGYLGSSLVCNFGIERKILCFFVIVENLAASWERNVCFFFLVLLTCIIEYWVTYVIWYTILSFITACFYHVWASCYLKMNTMWWQCWSKHISYSCLSKWMWYLFGHLISWAWFPSKLKVYVKLFVIPIRNNFLKKKKKIKNLKKLPQPLPLSLKNRHP